MPLNQLYTRLPVAMETCFPARLSPYFDISTHSLSTSLSYGCLIGCSSAASEEWLFTLKILSKQCTTSADRDDCLQWLDHWWQDTYYEYIQLLILQYMYNIILSNHKMCKEQILTIHLRHRWCFPYYRHKLSHQYLAGLWHLGHLICALLFKHNKTTYQMADSLQLISTH